MKNNLIGKRFGRLLVIAAAAPTAGNRTRWSCLCDCRKTTIVRAENLTRGDTKSCGCLKKELISRGPKLRHGMARSPTYKIWTAMKARCLNPNTISYPQYGGVGITVCDEWLTFDAFLADMGPRPDGLTLDRIDPAKGYGPQNCRWATYTEQANNQRRTKRLTFNGKSLTASEWARELSLPSSCIEGRMRLGWPLERILTEPLGPTHKRY